MFRDLADESSRLILDLPDPGAEAGALRLGLDPALGTFSRDSAWFGLTRWRELVAQFFDPPCRHDRLSRIESVHVEALSPDPRRPPRLAIWMVAWLAGQLGWKLPDHPHTAPAADSDDLLQTSFLGPDGDVAVSIATRPNPAGRAASPQLMGLTIKIRGSGDGGETAETCQLSRVEPDSPAIQIKAEAHRYVPSAATGRGPGARASVPDLSRPGIVSDRSTLLQCAADRSLAAGIRGIPASLTATTASGPWSRAGSRRRPPLRRHRALAIDDAFLTVRMTVLVRMLMR